jgi:hypothetical protein
MAPIVQPYSQDACGIGYGALSALGWAESRFGIDFLVVFFSIIIISVIIISLDVPPPLLSRRHLYCHANACLIGPLSHSGWLSISSLKTAPASTSPQGSRVDASAVAAS